MNKFLTLGLVFWDLTLQACIPELLGACRRKREREGKGFNNTWNEVVVAAGRLIIVPSWLQLTGSSVLCLEEVVKRSQTSCTQQVCHTHLQLDQTECVWHQRARSTHFSANNHITQGKIHSNPPTAPHLPPGCKAVWCGNRGGWGVGSGPDGASESRWRKTCSTLIWLHITHVSETLLSAQA